MKRGKTGCRGKSATPSYRALAKSLRRSPSHIFRVMQGERKPSAELERKMRKLGLKVDPPSPSGLRRDKREAR